MFSSLSSAIRIWAVFATKTHKEAQALAFLEKEGYKVYCPNVLGRRNRAPQALFPGYLFVWCSPKAEVPKVRYFPFIIKPLLFGDQVAGIEEDLIAKWKQKEGTKGYVVPEAPSPFKKGQHVRFKDGAFAGLEGTVLASLPAKERVKVLLAHLGGEISVEVDRFLLA